MESKRPILMPEDVPTTWSAVRETTESFVGATQSFDSAFERAANSEFVQRSKTAAAKAYSTEP